MFLEQLVDGDEVPAQVLRGHLALHVADPGLDVVHRVQELLLLPRLLQLLTLVRRPAGK